MTEQTDAPDPSEEAPNSTPLIEEADLQKIGDLMAEIEELKAELTALTREYQVGGFDEKELEELRSLDHEILELKRTILDYLAAARSRARGKNVISADEVDTTYQPGEEPEGHPQVLDSGADITQDDYGILPFDDSSFENEFAASLRRWCGDAQGALNAATLDMFEVKGEEVEYKIDDFWTGISRVASLDPRAAAIVALINQVKSDQGLVLKIVNASSASIPPVNQLRNQLKDGYRLMGDKAMKGPFLEFVSQWKAANGYPESVKDVYEDEFMSACTNYEKLLPSLDDVERNFLTIVVNATQDKDGMFDSDDDHGFGKEVSKEHGELDGGEFPDAGYVDIWFVDKSESTGRRSPTARWKELHVGLNDVEAPIVQAVKSQWAGEFIVNLPFPIRFRINRPVTSGTLPWSDAWHGDFIAIRNSREPGNRNITVVQDWDTDDKKLNDAALERFKKALTEVKVDQL